MHLLNTKNRESRVFVSVDDTKRVERSLKKHSFNKSISLVYPTEDGDLEPRDLGNYYSADIALSTFLEDESLEVIRKHHLYALSQTRVDTQDSFCIIEGVLSLSLCKDTYQRAGLVGRPSKFTKHRFLVTLDFNDPKLTRESKQFARIRTSFNQVFSQVIPFYLSLPAGSSVPPYYGSGIPIQRTMHTESRLVPEWTDISTMPTSNSHEKDLWLERQEEIHTSLSLLTLSSTIPESVDPYISTYTCPEPNTRQEVKQVSWSGFIRPNFVAALFREMKGRKGWVVLQVRGYESTPIAWVGSEHSILSGGENCITILSDPRGTMDTEDETLIRTIMWEVVGAYDSHS